MPPRGRKRGGSFNGSLWAFSSVGQSTRLITARSTVRAREGPPKRLRPTPGTSIHRGIAQQVEQRSPKPRAEGSIPSAPARELQSDLFLY